MIHKGILLFSCLSAIVVGAVVTMLVLQATVVNVNTNELIVENKKQGVWITWNLRDPSEGDCGICGVYIVEHSATPNVSYTQNISASGLSIYASESGSGADGSGHIGTGVPFDTAFDIVITYLYNESYAYNNVESNDTWDKNWTQCLFKCTGLSIDTNISMNEHWVVTKGGGGVDETDGVGYMNFWLQDVDGNVGPGFTIGNGENITGANSCYWYGRAYI